MDSEQFIREFSRRIEDNQGIIFKVSGMYCTDKECRKDLFQEILIQLWRSYPSYDTRVKFSSWMYRVALNTAITQFRKDKRSKIDYVSELPGNPINEDLFEEKEERITLLNEAIRSLSKSERAIIILYMDDYSYEEIADIIGISNSNVGVKINRIKTKMKQILKELGYGL